MKIPFKFKDVHHCETVVLTCIDFRFWKETVQFIESELGIKTFDFPSLPGSAKAINESNDEEFIFGCISVPIELHHAEKIVIINHQDCGAYGGSAKFNGDEKTEQEFHENELKKAKEKISAKYPDKKIILVYAKLVDDKENIEFVTIN
jgi:hypothetical protein